MKRNSFRVIICREWIYSQYASEKLEGKKIKAIRKIKRSVSTESTDWYKTET